MKDVCLGFEVHQPMRLKHFPNNGKNLKNGELRDHFIDNNLNKFIFNRIASKCYYPATQILLDHVDNFKGQNREFKCSFNLSGVWIEQCEKWHPDLLEIFKQLAESGRVEFMGSTYYHSLASLFNHGKIEFIDQVKMQSDTMKDLLGIRPKFFLNTEMIANNTIIDVINKLGFDGVVTEGVERILGWRSPNYLYTNESNENIKILLRNYRLSDDVGYRFSSKEWNEWPLSAEKYAIWLHSTPGQVINIFMDYETFGEHHWQESGIFWFLKALPWRVFDWQDLEFSTPSEVTKKHEPVGKVNIPDNQTVSWADMERDVSAWLGNKMQQVAFEELEDLEKLLRKTNDKDLLRMWRLLQTSDHAYYACTKWWADGDVHRYFSIFETPHDGFINLFRAISDLKIRALKQLNGNGIGIKH